MESLVDNYKGGRFNRPNDVICHSNGCLYFTDPDKRRAYHEREIPGPEGDNNLWDGACIYRLAPDGSLTVLAHCERRWRRAHKERQACAGRQQPHTPQDRRFRPTTWTRPVRKGPVNPSRMMLIDTAAEIVPTLHPNARSSGRIITPGAARTPTPASMAQNITTHDPGVVHTPGKELCYCRRLHRVERRIAKPPTYRPAGGPYDPYRRMAASAAADPAYRRRRGDRVPLGCRNASESGMLRLIQSTSTKTLVVRD